MKSLVFVVLFFACSVSCPADCDAAISSTDTIGDVKRKLACFADENAKLKKQLASGSSGPLRIMGEYFRYKRDSVAECKTRAIDLVVQRGGSVTYQNSISVDLQLGENAISFTCFDPSADKNAEFIWALVDVSGYNHQAIIDLGHLLAIHMGE